MFPNNVYKKQITMLSRRKCHAAKLSKNPRKLDFSYTSFCLLPRSPQGSISQVESCVHGDATLGYGSHTKPLWTFFPDNMALLNRHCLQCEPNGYNRVLNHQLRLQGLVLSQCPVQISLSISSKSRQTMFALEKC